MPKLTKKHYKRKIMEAYGQAINAQYTDLMGNLHLTELGHISKYGLEASDEYWREALCFTKKLKIMLVHKDAVITLGIK